MCRCSCSVTHQKIWGFGLSIVFFVLGLVFVIWWPDHAEELLDKALPLTPSSQVYSKWAVSPLPIYNHMFLYNWTNADQAYDPQVKPHFEQVGPYVFREEKVKEDIMWHSNNTVTFYANRTWYFEPERSKGSLNDLVTCPHLPSIASASLMRDQGKIVKAGFNAALNRNGGALYQTHTAWEWLFDGFYDEFLDYAMNLNNSATAAITTNKFAYFLNRNQSKTFEGKFNIHTGVGDLTQMGELKFWNNANQTGYFEGVCGGINGSTEDLFVPKRPLDEYITVFVMDTRRIINLVPTGERIRVEGIDGMLYATNEHTYDNGQRNGDMKCYCPIELQPDRCPPSGATDLRGAAEGVPMYLSHPHFMYADPKYTENITGMNEPDPETDSFFIILEPRLGVPLQVQAAVQVSLLVQRDDDIDVLKGLNDFYAPLFITLNRARIDKELAREVQTALNLANIGRDIGIFFITLGAVLLIISLVLTMTHSWVGQRKPSHLSDLKEELSPAGEVNENANVRD